MITDRRRRDVEEILALHAKPITRQVVTPELVGAVIDLATPEVDVDGIDPEIDRAAEELGRVIALVAKRAHSLDCTRRRTSSPPAWGQEPRFSRFNVRLAGELIDRVSFSGNPSEGEVARSLIEHDSYNPSIEVRRVES